MVVERCIQAFTVLHLRSLPDGTQIKCGGMAGNKAVLINTFTRDLQNLAGGLEVKETAIPEPAEGRVLVQISLRPIHPVILNRREADRNFAI